MKGRLHWLSRSEDSAQAFCRLRPDSRKDVSFYLVEAARCNVITFCRVSVVGCIEVIPVFAASSRMCAVAMSVHAGRWTR